MTQPEQDSPQNTRDRLIEAAIFCFSEKGFDATGIREIAQRAQANSALVQYHFGGKEGLYTAALTHIFQDKAAAVTQPPTDPEAPGARAQAIQALREMLQHLVHELLQCNAGSELEKASLLLVTREMQNPRSEALPMLLGHIRPYEQHLDGCLRILRPELDLAGRQDMGLNIFGPIFYLHTALPLVRGMREDPAFPRDLDQLANHFIEFSLRGIGLPEATPPQGA